MYFVAVFDVFGVLMYTLAMFIWMFWQTKRAPRYQYHANPLQIVVNHINALDENEKEKVGKGSGDESDDEQKGLYRRFEFVMIMIWAQGVGAYLAYNFVMHTAWNYASYWTMWKETNYHVTRYKTANKWTSSMSVISLAQWNAFKVFLAMDKFMLSPPKLI